MRGSAAEFPKRTKKMRLGSEECVIVSFILASPKSVVGMLVVSTLPVRGPSYQSIDSIQIESI